MVPDRGGQGTSAMQIRDAEMSVDFLCRKFEALSEQLRREEHAREAEEQRGRQLTSEVESAEEAASKQRGAFAVELSAKENLLAGLRATASGAGQRAATQESRVQEEQTAGARLEQLCCRLSDECKAEATMADKAQERISTADRDMMQDHRERGELGHRMRCAQADARVVLEDLFIAKQRALLVHGEQQALEQSLNTTSRTSQSSGQECEVQSRSLHDKSLQATSQDQRAKALTEAIEAARSENVKKEQRISVVREEEWSSQAQLSALRQELARAQLEAQSTGSELETESEAVAAVEEQIRRVEAQKAADTQEVAALHRSLAEMETALEGLRKGAEEARRAKNCLATQLTDVNAEEQRLASSAGGLRHTRYEEDLAFEDVQAELQVAFRKQEALAEDLVLNARGKDAVQAKIRRLQPEICEADDRCLFLEEQLALRSRELEAELVQQRSAHQEVVSVSDAMRQLQRQEANMESMLISASPRGGPLISSDASPCSFGYAGHGGSRAMSGSPVAAGCADATFDAGGRDGFVQHHQQGVPRELPGRRESSVRDHDCDGSRWRAKVAEQPCGLAPEVLAARDSTVVASTPAFAPPDLAASSASRCPHSATPRRACPGRTVGSPGPGVSSVPNLGSSPVGVIYHPSGAPCSPSGASRGQPLARGTSPAALSRQPSTGRSNGTCMGPRRAPSTEGLPRHKVAAPSALGCSPTPAPRLASAAAR